MKTFLTILLTIVATLVAVGVVAWLLGAADDPDANALKVRLERPKRGELVEIVSAPGAIEPKTKVSISARVSARITELPYDEHDRVVKGDPKAVPPVPASVLVRLDATDLEAALRSAKARRAAKAGEIKVAQASISSAESRIEGLRASQAEAKKDLARQKTMRASRDVSQSVYDKAVCRVDELAAQLKSSAHDVESQKLRLEVMRHQLDAADAEIAQAEDKLSYTTIASPIDGVVTRLNAEVGELVVTGTMNNPGTVIIEVADLSKMLVVAQVDEADIGAVRVGQRAVIRIAAYPDREFEGTVDSIALKGTGQRRESKEFNVEILLKTGKEEMYSGLTADVEILTRRHANQLKIPSQAVLGRKVDDLPRQFREGNPLVDKKKTFATVVYRYLNKKAVLTPVKVGPSDVTHTAIVEGLGESDRVIVGPYKVLEKLKHDQRVKDEREADAAKSGTSQPAQSQPSSATQDAKR